MRQLCQLHGSFLLIVGIFELVPYLHFLQTCLQLVLPVL